MENTDEYRCECPHCGQHLALDASLLNTEIVCPTCGNPLEFQPDDNMSDDGTSPKNVTSGVPVSEEKSGNTNGSFKVCFARLGSQTRQAIVFCAKSACFVLIVSVLFFCRALAFVARAVARVFHCLLPLWEKHLEPKLKDVKVLQSLFAGIRFFIKTVYSVAHRVQEGLNPLRKRIELAFAGNDEHSFPSFRHQCAYAATGFALFFAIGFLVVGTGRSDHPDLESSEHQDSDMREHTDVATHAPVRRSRVKATDKEYEAMGRVLHAQSIYMAEAGAITLLSSSSDIHPFVRALAAAGSSASVGNKLLTEVDTTGCPNDFVVAWQKFIASMCALRMMEGEIEMLGQAQRSSQGPTQSDVRKAKAMLQKARNEAESARQMFEEVFNSYGAERLTRETENVRRQIDRGILHQSDLLRRKRKTWSGPDGIEWDLIVDGEKAEIIGMKHLDHSGQSAQLSIPEKIGVWTVVGIGPKVFSGDSFTQIAFPKTIRSVGESAFADCRHLERLVVPASLSRLGESSFSGCSALKSVHIEEGVTSLPKGCFAKCQTLSDVVLPSSIRDIGSSAFLSCSSLESLAIPNSVTNIGSEALANCKSLRTATLPLSIESIPSGLFRGCVSLQELRMPKKLREIGYNAFDGCKELQTIAIPASVWKIGGCAFRGCEKLEQVAIPNGVREINWSTFENCSALKEVALPEGLEQIGGSSFAYCLALQKIVIPSEVTKIGDSAFEGCTALRNVQIPNHVIEIGKYAFARCASLTRMVVPSSVKKIGEHAFEYCIRLPRVELEPGERSLGYGAIETEYGKEPPTWRRPKW